MLRVLVKKQLMEIFRGYFYNERKGERRSIAGTIGMFVIFGCMMCLFLGGMFLFVSFMLASTVLSMQLDWLYFVLMGFASILIGVFGSVFATYSSLYLSKDNEMLFALPIPERDIIFSRLLSVLALVALYTLLAWIPSQIVYFLYQGFDFSKLLTSCLSGIVVVLIVMVLTCLLGMVVAKVSVKLKNRSFITVLISLASIGLYYLFTFHAEGVITPLLQSIIAQANTIPWYAYPIYIFGQGTVGNWVFECIVLIAIVVLTYVVYALLQKNFFGLALASNTIVSTQKKQTYHVKSVTKALFQREWKHFSSSATYMLNTALSSVLAPIVAIVFVFKTKEVLAVLKITDMFDLTTLGTILIFGICILLSLNDVSAPSVSLEGKSLWIIRSLPVSSWDALKAKIKLHVLVTIIPSFVAMCVGIWFVQFHLFLSIFMVITPVVYVVFTGLLGLALNLLMPNLHWTSETTPLKTAMNVFLTMLIDLAIPIVALVILGATGIDAMLYLTIFTFLIVVVDILLIQWIKTKGVQIFAAL